MYFESLCINLCFQRCTFENKALKWYMRYMPDKSYVTSVINRLKIFDALHNPNNISVISNNPNNAQMVDLCTTSEGMDIR